MAAVIFNQADSKNEAIVEIRPIITSCKILLNVFIGL